MLHGLRRLARRCGVDISRYPEATPEYRANRLLLLHRIDLVLDVGANEGDYAATLRSSGYRGDIVSFEPVQEAFRRLREKSAADPSWTAVPCALGDSDTTVEIHVAGNSAASSSVLSMLPLHSQAAPESTYVGAERVQQRRLDSAWSEFVPPGRRVFLKVDVQGAEKHVLTGTGDRLAHCLGVQLEVSFAPLYEGGMLYREALDQLEDAGLSPAYVLPGFTDRRTGRMYQCDVVCFRE